MVDLARSVLVVVLIVQAGRGVASPLSNRLEAAARHCFESPDPARCDAVWDLSAELKEQADSKDQFRCHTSALTVEAMVSMARQGVQDVPHQQAALEAMERDCP